MSESDDTRPTPSEKESWRDRVFKLRMLIAVGAAGVLTPSSPDA